MMDSAIDERYPAGRLQGLWRYPVKSLAAEALASVSVGAFGLEGDRERALFVASAGHARAGKPYRGKEHNLLHTVGSVEAGIDLAAGRAVEVRPRGGGPHFDDGVVSIVFDTWIAELEALVGRPLDPLRFRPNLYVAAEPGFAQREADLVGARIVVDAVAFEVVNPIERCVTPSYDVATGESDPLVLRAVARDRGNVLGVYCTVATGGTLVRVARVAIRARPLSVTRK